MIRYHVDRDENEWISIYMTDSKEDILLSRKEAAKMLGLEPITLAVWKCNDSHDLPYVKIGNLVKYKLSDIREFIAKRVVSRKK